jgi:hypothetical protein
MYHISENLVNNTEYCKQHSNYIKLKQNKLISDTVV